MAHKLHSGTDRLHGLG